MKITRTFLLIGAILLMAAALASADPTVKVAFPEKGSYVYWIEFKDPQGKSQVLAPKHVAGADAAVDLAPAASLGKLLSGELKIYDPRSGNVAAKSLENLADKKDLKLKTADFDRVRTVRILLRPMDGKPDERVETAVVTIKDANSDEHSAVIDPLGDGTAEFHDVAAGMENMTVAYDGGKMSVDQEIPLERDTPIFTHAIAISAKVRTVKAAAAAGAKPAEGEDAQSAEPKKPVKASPAAMIMGVLAGFIFIGMVCAVVFVLVKSKGGTLKGGLEKLGAQFPDAATGPEVVAAAPTPQVDPNTCQFCGQKKDANGNCACSIGGAPAAGGSASTGIPRLIGTQGPYSGHIFELSGAEATIGRDTGNVIPLDQDSTSSRRHARVARDNGSFVITDEGSSNGTFVNGAKIMGSHTLRSGDEVQIGSTKFRFEL